MARRGRSPVVFVRRLTKAQKRKIKKTVERGGGMSPVKWRRSLVVSMSSQGKSAAGIAGALGADDDWVRDVIHAFNRDRMDSLRPRWAGGRPPKFSQEMRAQIVEIAATRPQLFEGALYPLVAHQACRLPGQEQGRCLHIEGEA